MSGCWRWWAKACGVRRGLRGACFQAISEQDVNIIAIAQGSSELTISIVVRRDGLERAIQAVHRECR
jgi:aspartokinase/homoserine dehydrogenase 1